MTIYKGHVTVDATVHAGKKGDFVTFGMRVDPEWAGTMGGSDLLDVLVFYSDNETVRRLTAGDVIVVRSRDDASLRSRDTPTGPRSSWRVIASSVKVLPHNKHQDVLRKTLSEPAGQVLDPAAGSR